jgi:hypothetical protein
MRYRRWPVRILSWCTLAVLFVATSSGCGGKPVGADWFKARGSYDLDGERVQIQLLRIDELWNFGLSLSAADKDRFQGRLKKEFPHVYGKQLVGGGYIQPTGVAPIAAAAAVLIPALVGFATDQVKSDLQKEAAIFTAQFSKKLYATDFWQNVSVDQGTPSYYGFLVTRGTKASRAEKVDAFRMVCAMIPSTEMALAPANSRSDDNGPQGVRNADARLFVIKPLLVQTNRSKAKVYEFGAKKLNSTVNVALDATWIDGAGTIHNQRLGSGDLTINGYEFAKHPILIDDDEIRDEIVGWFPGVPLSEKDGKPVGTGAFALTVMVTESDQSEAQQTLEQIATFVTNQGNAIVKAATQPSTNTSTTAK